MGSGDILSTDSRYYSSAFSRIEDGKQHQMPIETMQMQQCPVNIEGTVVRFCLRSSWLMASTIYDALYY
jgi:hypothetical protein